MADDDPKTSTPIDNEYEVPYYNPLDEFTFTDEELQNIMANPNPNLLDLSFPQTPSTPFPPNETQFLHENSLSISDPKINAEFNGQPFVDENFHIGWNRFDDVLNNNVTNNVPGVIGNNNNVGETTRLEVTSRVFGDNNDPIFDPGGPSTMPFSLIPPITEGTLQCNCCNILREIDYSNGYEVHTLCIYGGIGFVCHAISESRLYANRTESRRHTYHLKYLPMEDVKMFIENYCSLRDAEGFVLERNTNVAFYQAMSATSIYNQLSTLTTPSPMDVSMSLPLPDEALNVPPVPLRIELRDEATTGLSNERERRKTPLAAQRERTGKMTLKDISMHFHLPIEEAAKQMNLCPTVLKKICRKGGLSRWPHRKIKSILKKISSLRNMLLTAKDELEKSNIETEVERLERDIDTICSEALRNAK